MLSETETHQTWNILARNTPQTRERVQAALKTALEDSINKGDQVEVIQNHVAADKTIDIYLPTRRTVIMCSDRGG